jgi:ATP-binding cassette subfamily F protein 3
MVAEATNLGKTYGVVGDGFAADAKTVFRSASFMIDRGDRIALVGPNGAGKSTLIKLLAGLERPTAGDLRLGHNVQADYFAQDQYRELDAEARVLDGLWSLAPARSQTELRNLLGCFLFSGDDVFKRVGVLSGGERNRYALARMLLRPANFLLLDEPTNHLDLRAKDVLLEALRSFTGTIVFVSHDRYFIDRLATRVFEVGEGEVRIYSGNYEDYWRQKERPAGAAVVAGGDSAAAASPAGNSPQAGVAAEDADTQPAARRINPQRLRQMQERCTELEELVARTEADIAGCEEALSAFVSPDETQRQIELLARKRAELESLMAEWEGLASVLEGSS